ncbi:MAG: DNA-directed RNA polymerase subunit G [Desulfurococcaceae archaeon]
MYRYECSVYNIEYLKLPKVYRLKCNCSDGVEIVFEMHEELLKIRENTEISIDIGIDKKECLERDFCGKAHVVSVTELEGRFRTVLSIGGLLVVVKNLVEKPSLEPVQELYVGLSIKK